MTKLCGWCGKVMEITEDFPDLSSDHGKCDECREITRKETDALHTKWAAEEQRLREKLDRLMSEPTETEKILARGL